MNLQYFIQRFSNNRLVFESLLSHVSDELARWKPHSDKWSMLEVVNHLYDEEREDFRRRLHLTLADPLQPWPSINPREWVVSRAYNDRDLKTSLANFIAERESSLEWLEQLTEPNWNNTYTGTSIPVSAGDLLASWLAHDFLHIRQLARLHWQYVGELSAPYETGYGGPWQETPPAS